MDAVTFSSRIACDLVDYVEGQGFDVDPLKAVLALPDPLLRREDTRIPSHKMSELWSLAMSVTGDPWVALHMGADQVLSSLRTTSLIMQSTRTVEEAMEAGIAYSSLIANALEMKLGVQGSSMFIEFTPHPAWAVEPDEVVWDSIGVTFVSMLHTTRQLVGRPVTPSILEFQFPCPENAHEFFSYFDCSIDFDSSSNRMGFSKKIAGEAVRTSDDGLLDTLKRYADELRSSFADDQDHSAKARALIAKMMDPKPPSLDEVASAMHVSPRSLQRKIKQERDCTFQGLVDEVRIKLCAKLLSDKRRSVEQVGYLAGYADSTSFIRAYRRWHGRTPRQTSSTQPGAGREQDQDDLELEANR